MERVINVTLARKQFGTLLDEVFHKGETVTVERKGRPLARIVPVADQEADARISSRQKALLNELNSLPVLTMDQDPVAVLRTLRERKRIRAGKQYGG
jgi:prevent-host-death family protein